MAHNSARLLNTHVPGKENVLSRSILWTVSFLLVLTPLLRASVPGWAVTVIQMVTFTAFFLLLIADIWQSEWSVERTPLDMPLCVLILYISLSALFSEHAYTSIRAMMLMITYIATFFMMIRTMRTRSQFRMMVYLIFFSGLCLSVFGLMKNGGYNPFPWWEYRFDSGRVNATYVNPDHFAGYLEMVIPLTAGLLLTGIRKEKQALLIFSMLLMSSALIFTLSRGGWIGLMMALFFEAACLFFSPYFKYKKALMTLGISFFLTGMIILSGTDVVTRILTFAQGEDMPSLSARLTAWKGGADMISDYPWLGSGPGTFAFIFTQYEPPGLNKYYDMAHNDYLHFVAEAGLPLMIIIIWLMYGFYRTGFRKLRNPSRLVRGITLGAMSGVTAILVHSVGDFNLHIPANAYLFTCLAAIAAAPLPKTG